jgi:hypothetical protein
MPKEKESEIVFLRETMEQNEQVIFRVYEEKEKMWERELKKMKNLYEARLKANQQKASKMEAVLLNQTYQVDNYGFEYFIHWKIESSFVIGVHSLPSRHGKKGG